MSERLTRALRLATEAHAGQRRKVDGSPYISHPLGVALILQRAGYDETLVAAALLHDTLEDTSLALETIVAECGRLVGAIVAGCSEGDGDWETRKRQMIDRVAGESAAVKLVVAADKLHNVGQLPQEAASPAWQNFKRGPRAQAWYYHQMLGAIWNGLPNAHRHPMVDRLAVVVQARFGPTVPKTPA